MGNNEVQPDLTIANLAGDRPEDLRLCKLLARPGQALLIVIGSQLQSNQLLEMFEAGITDYLARPVNLRELVARVSNILHRTQPPFQLDGTAVSSDSQAIGHQTTPLARALRDLAGRLVRCIPQQGP